MQRRPRQYAPYEVLHTIPGYDRYHLTVRYDGSTSYIGYRNHIFYHWVNGILVKMVLVHIGINNFSFHGDSIVSRAQCAGSKWLFTPIDGKAIDISRAELSCKRRCDLVDECYNNRISASSEPLQIRFDDTVNSTEDWRFAIHGRTHKDLFDEASCPSDEYDI